MIKVQIVRFSWYERVLTYLEHVLTHRAIHAVLERLVLKIELNVVIIGAVTHFFSGEHNGDPASSCGCALAVTLTISDRVNKLANSQGSRINTMYLRKKIDCSQIYEGSGTLIN